MLWVDYMILHIVRILQEDEILIVWLSLLYEPLDHSVVLLQTEAFLLYPALENNTAFYLLIWIGPKGGVLFYIHFEFGTALFLRYFLRSIQIFWTKFPLQILKRSARHGFQVIDCFHHGDYPNHFITSEHISIEFNPVKNQPILNLINT